MAFGREAVALRQLSKQALQLATTKSNQKIELLQFFTNVFICLDFLIIEMFNFQKSWDKRKRKLKIGFSLKLPVYTVLHSLNLFLGAKRSLCENQKEEVFVETKSMIHLGAKLGTVCKKRKVGMKTQNPF